MAEPIDLTLRLKRAARLAPGDRVARYVKVLLGMRRGNGTAD
jgi:hypothetical protein